MIEHSDIVVAVAMRTDWPARHPSPKKSPALRIATTASLLGDDRELDLALLDIKDCVGRGRMDAPCRVAWKRRTRRKEPNLTRIGRQCFPAHPQTPPLNEPSIRRAASPKQEKRRLPFLWR